MEPEPQAYEPTVITEKATVDSMGIYLSYKERYIEIAQIQKIRDHNRERSKCSEMVAETIYMAWNSILCHPYSVDCHSFAHLNRWCR